LSASSGTLKPALSAVEAESVPIYPSLMGVGLIHEFYLMKRGLYFSFSNSNKIKFSNATTNAGQASERS
jgi:hypothetical protein